MQINDDSWPLIEWSAWFHGHWVNTRQCWPLIHTQLCNRAQSVTIHLATLFHHTHSDAMQWILERLGDHHDQSGPVIRATQRTKRRYSALDQFAVNGTTALVHCLMICSWTVLTIVSIRAHCDSVRAQWLDSAMRVDGCKQASGQLNAVDGTSVNHSEDTSTTVTHTMATFRMEPSIESSSPLGLVLGWLLLRSSAYHRWRWLAGRPRGHYLNFVWTNSERT